MAYKNRNEKQKHIKSVHLFVCLLFFLKSFVFSFLTVGGASGSLIVSRVHINNVLAFISSNGFKKEVTGQRSTDKLVS